MDGVGFAAVVRLDGADFKHRQEREKKRKKKNKIYLECESNQDVVFFWDVVHVGKSECNSVTLARDFHRACWVNIESYVVGRGADPHPL